jgi:hypothetical protein
LPARSGPESPLLRESRGFPDRASGPSSHILAAPANVAGAREVKTMSFVLLALLLVSALVVLLLSLFFLVRRWL